MDFDQLSDAACTRKLVEILFGPLSEFFLFFSTFLGLFLSKKKKKGGKKLCILLLLKLVDIQMLIDSLRFLTVVFKNPKLV